MGLHLLGAVLLLLGQQSPKSVVVVVLDDIAAKDCSAYGGRFPTPNLSLMAQNGVRFDRAYSNPTCSPSRRSMMFGYWWTGESGDACPPIVGPMTPKPTEVSLAEALPGHESTFIGKWHLGALGGYCAPLTEGFDHQVLATPHNVTGCDGSSYSNWKEMTTACTLESRLGYLPRLQRDAFRERRRPTGPSLTYWGLSLAHGPFHRPPADMLPPGYKVGTSQESKYEAMVVAADRIVGDVLRSIDLCNTVVIVVGDNGTPDQVTPEPGRSKTTTFERGVHVPFLVVGAGVIKGAPSQALVHLVDVYATVIELGGQVFPGGPSLSVVPALMGLPFEGHDMVLMGHRWGTGSPADGAVVSQDGLKLRLLDTDGDGAHDVEELYELPDETTNIIDSPALSAKVATMRSWFLAEKKP